MNKIHPNNNPDKTRWEKTDWEKLTEATMAEIERKKRDNKDKKK